jgi:hypothetical protein
LDLCAVTALYAARRDRPAGGVCCTLLAGAEFLFHAIYLDLVATGLPVGVGRLRGHCKAGNNGKRGEGSDHGWFSRRLSRFAAGCAQWLSV